MHTFWKKIRPRKRRSPNAPDVGVGSQARPSSNSSSAIVQQGPALHAPGTDPSAVPMPSSSPPARSEDVAPSTSGLGRSTSDDDLASDGGDASVSVTSKDDLVVAGDVSESSGPPTPQASALKDAVGSAEVAYAGANRFGERSSKAAQLADDSATAADDWFERIDGLFDKISAFSDMVSIIGELHPYAKIATSLFQAGLKPILKQKARDDHMKKLIDDMTDAYDVVMSHDHQLNGVKDDKNDPRCKLLARLAQQTAECAAFIREHYETKNFYTRAIKTIPKSAIDEKIVDYSQAFVELGQKIAERDVSHIMELVTTVSINESHIEATLRLQELEYAEGTGWQGHNACLPGTRTATLDSLAHWVFDLAASRGHFVVGVAGVGKSSIAHSIASRLEAFGRLGAFFRFDRTNQRLAPWSVFSTVARELADWNADFRHELSAVLSQKGRLAKSRDVIEQWEDLIVQPAKKVHFVGPVLIVVDAFDECTDLRGPALAFDRDQQDRQHARKNLLDCLTKRVEELPLNFRILVTSRLEEDVVAVAGAIRATASCAVVFYDLSHAEVEAHQGIELYIRHELHDSLGDEQITVLVNASDRLFEWAATACRYLLDSVAGSTVLERYLEWFEGQAGIVHEASRSLELLYHTILGQRFTDKMGLKRFCDVMAQVLYAAEPVSWDTLVALRRTVDESDNVVNLVISHLGSLLSGVGEHSVPIRPLHTSFRDFLTRADVAHSWHVQPGDVHDVIALGALRVLNKSLHFNIWDFPSSYVFNDMIDDLDDRMEKLPAGLVYASQHWSYHLSMVSKLDVRLQTELRIFLTQKLLFWLEVASLCDFMDRVVSGLLVAASFLKQFQDDDVIAFINDTILFVRNLIQPMDYLSVPHIYLSGLAFCPTTSLIRRTFVRNSNLLPAVDGLAAAWPVVVCPHLVRCFAYSPDGIYMALGCWDGDVRLVEAENMHNSVLELARAPDYPPLWIASVAFSPDGQIIAADAAMGDGISVIFRWNAKTGEMLGISQGHTDYVHSLCFLPDGRYIVSASHDNTVRRWDAKTGQQIGDPLRGHTGRVYGAVCSLNSDFIISAGDDATIRIWAADNGQQDGPPISTPGRRPIRMLARSPNRNLIAVGLESEDSSSVWIFDVDQRCFVRELLRQQQNGLPHIAWSRDGRFIASASSGIILLWDSLDSSSSTLYTRATSTYNIEFSPNGNRICSALGGDFQTVDVAAARSQSSEYDTRGRTEYAAYSPDGRFAAVTFGGEKVPCVWEAETGASISDDHVLTASLAWLKLAMDGPLQHYTSYTYDWYDRKKHRPYDIVSANGHRSAGVLRDEISIWDSVSQTLLEPCIRIPSGNVTCVALSPSGDCVLQGSSDGTIRIFHIDQSTDNAPLPAEDSASGTRRSHSPEGEHGVLVLRRGILGWLHDNDDRPIIFVPEQYRADLWLPGLVHILRPNREPATPRRINFSGVGLGTEWTRCGGALSVDLGNARMSSEPVAND